MASNNTQQFTAVFSLNGQQVKDEIKNITARITELDQQMAKLPKDAADYKQKLKALNDEQKGLKENLRQMQQLGNVVRDSMKRLDNASPKELKKVINDINRAMQSGAIKRGTKDWDEAIKVMARAKNELNKFNQELNAAGRSGGGGGGNILSTLMGGAGFGAFATKLGVLGAAAGAVVKVFGDMVSINKEFEQSNANLASILGTNIDGIKDLSAQAKQLGASTQFSASQVTLLQTELAKLGFTKTEITAATQSVLNFSAATGAELPEAAALAGAALRAWQLDASEMERVVSTMSVATTKSALDFSKLQTSIGIVAPVAKQFGFTIEDTVALLGKLSDAGFDASSAATAVRNIFLYMADPASKLSKALGGPIKSLDDLAPAFQRLTDRGIDLAEMLDVTDKRAVSAFATLVSGGNSLIDLRDSITDCGDALEDMVDTRMNTLEGATKRLDSAWEGLMLAFSNSTGPMKTVVDWLAEIINKVTTLFNSHEQLRDERIEAMAKTLANEKDYLKFLEAEREMGISDEEIIIGRTNALAKEQKQYADMIKELDKMHNARAGGNGGAYNGKIYTDSQLAEMEKQLENRLAYIKSYINREKYLIDALTPKNTNTDTGDGGGGGTYQDKGYAARMKAQYDAEAKAQIAALDQKLLNEQEYEEKVYQIKLAALEQTKSLYKEGTKEYSQSLAAISSLETSHQAKMLSITEREAGKREREEERAQKETDRARRNSVREEEKNQKEISDIVKRYTKTKEEILIDSLMEDRNKIIGVINDLLMAGEDIPDEILATFEKITAKINNTISNGDGIDWNKFWRGGNNEDGEKIPGFDDYYSKVSEGLSALGDLISASYDQEIAATEKKYDALIKQAEQNGKDTTKLEEQKEQAVNVIKKQAAEKEFKVNILSAITDAAVGVGKTLSAYAYPWNLAMAALHAAVSSVQIATIKKNYEAQLAGYSSGGFTDDDHTSYVSSGSGQRYQRPAGIVHDGEFVANHYAVNNPEVRPTLDLLDYAQRTGSIASLTREQIARANGYASGAVFAAGGYTSQPAAIVNQGYSSQTSIDAATINALTQVLATIQRDGIEAYSVISGPHGSYRQTQRYQTIINNKSRK